MTISTDSSARITHSALADTASISIPSSTPALFVRLKMAASLDGITALPDGRSQWITSAQAREDGHRWRARADAILTGVGTILADDPRLDVRLPGDDADHPKWPIQQPALCIVDTHLRTPPSARLFAAHRPVHLFAANEAPTDREAPLQASGATVHRIDPTDANGRPDLGTVLATIARTLPCATLHVEAGAVLSGALLRQRLVDELLIYLAPTLLGSGRPMAVMGPLGALTDGVALEWKSIEPVGDDLRIVATIRHNRAQ